MTLRAPCSATERLRAPAVSVKVGMDNERTRLGLLDLGSEEEYEEEGERVERLGGGRQGCGAGHIVEGQCEALRAAEPGEFVGKLLQRAGTC